jgi:hypothetical protein
MTGDPSDIAARLRAILPNRWFGDNTPILDAVLLGIGTGWSAVYSLVQFVILQARILTATGDFLDLIANDFFGITLYRYLGEDDDDFLRRVRNELLRPRGTRSAMALCISELTGAQPLIFEPANPSDTGGYGIGGVGYCAAGGYGSLMLPYQFFMTVNRPPGGGIVNLAGYGTGGYIVYGSLAMEPPNITDAEIYDSVSGVLPTASVAWIRILG